ncbi:MAG TPA: SpoIIE family protein phosphatase [Thermoanaerobaculia bacterium]|jgi:serine phosphatase RsbU (regulator of sigma subunit)/pSer/pThr/pTyr-binding forkhead associated (FHA) protein
MELDPHVRLTLFQPGLAPQQLSLPAGVITLGRAHDCTVPIKDRFLSRRHAEIVHDDGGWLLRDCGSVNGTLLNGLRVLAPQPLRPGDRIGLGDSEVVFNAPEDDTSQIVAVDGQAPATNMTIAVDLDERGDERTQILNALAVEFLADRPMAELFDFILDKVSGLLRPTRCAIATIGGDKTNFENVKLRRSTRELPAELRISRTLLRDVVEGRQVVSFFDRGGDDDDRLANAESIISQRIRSAVCAPLLVGDAVLGVLYIDFVGAAGAVTENDVRLVAQIARFAAVTLERTRLREEALAKAKIDEELRTAYTIQSRLLPAQLPAIDGYRFAGTNRPCKTVSGDYYDVVVRPDGRIYFVIADVSGKGITAALVMSSVATAFNIFTRSDPAPADLLREINATLAPKTSPTKFVTLFAGVLDPARGVVDFANGGHVPPLVVGRDGVRTLKTTDLVVGLFPTAQYRNQSVELAPGDSLVMFTDGVIEAENAAEEQLGVDPVAELLQTMHGTEAARILETIDERVRAHIGDVPAGDDVTMLAVTRV